MRYDPEERCAHGTPWELVCHACVVEDARAAAAQERQRERWAELLEEAAGAVRDGHYDRAIPLTTEAQSKILATRVGDR